jgi:hypothetical protein
MVRRAAKKKKPTTTKPTKPDIDRIDFHYIKSNSFRVIQAQGAIGGPSPKGKGIQMAVFNERFSIPQKTTFKIAKGKLDEEISRVDRGGIVREVEAEIVMSLEDAEAIATWLAENIKTVKAIREMERKK